MNKAQQLFQAIKQAFTASDELSVALTTHKLASGGELSVDKLEVGGSVTISSQPAAAGDYKLEDGTVVKVDSVGMITEVVAPVAETAVVATGDGQATTAVAADLTTPEGMRKAYDKFATGTPEERVSNLETLCKAMMEYCFGWQLREAQAKQITDEAIRVYKELADTNAAAVVTQSAMMKQMIGLMEEVVGTPQADPPEDTKKKFSFANTEAKAKSLTKFQAAAARIHQEFEDHKKEMKAV